MTIQLNPKPVLLTPDNSSNTKHRNNNYKQQPIILYFTPPNMSPHTTVPSALQKDPVRRLRNTYSTINLYHTHLILETNESQVNIQPPSQHKPRWRQTSLAQFINFIHPFRLPESKACPSAPKKKFHNARLAILSYHRSKRQTHKITRYTVSLPTHDLFDSWGALLR
jgi:hypothetical protein